MSTLPSHQAPTFPQRVRELLSRLAALEVVPQAEAEAGTATTERIWTAQRVAQAIAALGGGGGGGTDLSYTASSRLLESSTGADVTLPLMSATNAGLVPASGGGTTNFLRADGAFAPPTGDPAPTLYKVLTADATGQNNISAQPWFPSAGAVTVEGSTLYQFEGVLLLNSGTLTHSVSVSFGGTATITSFSWFGLGHKAPINGSTTTRLSMGVNSSITTERVLTISNSTAGATLYVRGQVRINAAGTFIPRFQYSAAPGSSTVLAGTWFAMWKWGASGTTSKGTWS